MRERFRKMKSITSLDYLLDRSRRVMELYDLLIETEDKDKQRSLKLEILDLEQQFPRDKPCGEYTDFSKKEDSV